MRKWFLAIGSQTGEKVWQHIDSARFWESNGGAGPRATPTIAEARVYSLGATGLVNALDAATGEKLWSRDATADVDTKSPYWGFLGFTLGGERIRRRCCFRNAGCLWTSILANRGGSVPMVGSATARLICRPSKESSRFCCWVRNPEQPVFHRPTGRFFGRTLFPWISDDSTRVYC